MGDVIYRVAVELQALFHNHPSEDPLCRVRRISRMADAGDMPSRPWTTARERAERRASPD